MEKHAKRQSGFRKRRYEPDTGTRDHKFLSYEAAIATRKFYRPGKEVGGERRSYPLCEDFGTHQVRTCQRMGCVVEKRPLVKYGLGVDLYFKGVKAMACLYLVASLLSAPAVVAFYTGSRASPEERRAEIRYTPAAALFYATLGSWGEHTRVCGREAEGGSLELKCPARTRIADVFAYYGTPGGYCACPEANTVQKDGTCPGAIEGAGCKGGKPCFAGVTELGDSCCARGKDGGRANFDSDVNPFADPTCDSATAKFIVQGLCLGEMECEIPVDGGRGFSWTPRGEHTSCGGFGADPANCTMAFDDAGELGACLGDGSDGAGRRSLIAVAFCGQNNLRILGGAFSASKQRVSFVLSVLDAVAAGLLLLAGLWLHGKEVAAGHLYKKYVCTPSDYTVALSRWSLPSNYETLDELAQTLTSHFEHVLSRAAPVARAGPVAVADVNFGINNRRVIRLMSQRGRLARRIDVLDARLRLLRSSEEAAAADGKCVACVCECGGSAETARVAHAVLKSEFDAVQTALNDLLRGAAAKKARAVTAYVTFRSEEGCLRCLQMYPPLLKSLAFFVQPLELRIGEEKRVVVLDQAEEPRNLYWENIGLRRGGTALRFVGVVLVFVALLLATSGVVYWAETVSAEFEAKFPTADCFPYARDDAIFYDKDLPETWAFTSSSGELSMADDPRGIRPPVRGGTP